jgi:hypothetical protein
MDSLIEEWGGLSFFEDWKSKNLELSNLKPPVTEECELIRESF